MARHRRPVRGAVLHLGAASAPIRQRSGYSSDAPHRHRRAPGPHRRSPPSGARAPRRHDGGGRPKRRLLARHRPGHRLSVRLGTPRRAVAARLSSASSTKIAGSSACWPCAARCSWCPPTRRPSSMLPPPWTSPARSGAATSSWPSSSAWTIRLAGCARLKRPPSPRSTNAARPPPRSSPGRSRRWRGRCASTPASPTRATSASPAGSSSSWRSRGASSAAGPGAPGSAASTAGHRWSAGWARRWRSWTGDRPGPTRGPLARTLRTRDEADIRWWTGLTARAVRAALATVGAEQVDVDGTVGYVLPGDVEATPDPAPWVALLPALDPTTMGWQARDWYLGGHKAQLFDSNGNAGPTIWADGRIVGGWAILDGGQVVTGLLEDVGPRGRTGHRGRGGTAHHLAWLGARHASLPDPAPRLAGAMRSGLRRWCSEAPPRPDHDRSGIDAVDPMCAARATRTSCLTDGDQPLPSRRALYRRGHPDGEPPRIAFRDGATGRRAALAGGPDVWQVIGALRDQDVHGDEAVRAVADLRWPDRRAGSDRDPILR